MVRRFCCCNKKHALCDASDSDSDAASETSSASSDMPSEVGEVFEADWWQEREFDSIFFAPGAFVQGSARDMSNTLQGDEGQGPVMTQTMKAIATELPDASPLDSEPLVRVEIPGVSIDGLRTRLEAEPFLFERIFSEELKATGFTPSSWQEGVRIPGTRIRGMKFQMPVPADIPAFVKRMVTVPDVADVRALYRLRCGSGRIDLVEQSITVGVPMGDAFRVQVTHSFEAAGQGVRYSKWVDLVWVKKIMGMLKTYISKETETKARAGAEVMQRVLSAECAA